MIFKFTRRLFCKTLIPKDKTMKESKVFKFERNLRKNAKILKHEN